MRTLWQQLTTLIPVLPHNHIPDPDLEVNIGPCRFLEVVVVMSVCHLINQMCLVYLDNAASCRVWSGNIRINKLASSLEDAIVPDSYIPVPEGYIL